MPSRLGVLPLHSLPAMDGFESCCWSSPENSRVTKGADLVGRFESELAPRHFCSNCGSSLYDDLGEKYFVAAGLMRDLELEPSFHIQVAYKADWDQIGGDAPQFAENPPA